MYFQTYPQFPQPNFLSKVKSFKSGIFQFLYLGNKGFIIKNNIGSFLRIQLIQSECLIMGQYKINIIFLQQMPKMNFPNHDYMRFKKSHSCKYNMEVDAEIYDNISGKNKANNNPIYSMMKSFSVIYRLCKNMNIKNNRSCPIKTQSALDQVGRKSYSSYFIKRSKSNDSKFIQGQNLKAYKINAGSSINLNQANDQLNTINGNLNRLKFKLSKNKTQMSILNTYSSKSYQHFQQMHSPLSDTSLQTYQQNKKLIQVCRQQIKIGKRKPSQRMYQIQKYEQPKVPLKKYQIMSRIKKSVKARNNNNKGLLNIKLIMR